MCIELFEFQISAWLEEDGFNADAATYEEKLAQVKSLTGPLLRRVREHEERPEAVKALAAKLDAAAKFAKAIREKTKEATDAGEETIFTTVEIDVLDKLISETKVEHSFTFQVFFLWEFNILGVETKNGSRSESARVVG